MEVEPIVGFLARKAESHGLHLPYLQYTVCALIPCLNSWLTPRHSDSTRSYGCSRTSSFREWRQRSHCCCIEADTSMRIVKCAYLSLLDDLCAKPLANTPAVSSHPNNMAMTRLLQRSAQSKLDCECRLGRRGGPSSMHETDGKHAHEERHRERRLHACQVLQRPRFIALSRDVAAVVANRKTIIETKAAMNSVCRAFSVFRSVLPFSGTWVVAIKEGDVGTIGERSADCCDSDCSRALCCALADLSTSPGATTETLLQCEHRQQRPSET